MALHRAKVVDLYLDRHVPDLDGLAGYGVVRALVRLGGTPLGYVDVPVVGGRCTADRLRAAAVRELNDAIIRQLLIDRLLDPVPDTSGWTAEALVDRRTAASPAGQPPLVTVAVCTRDRPDQLLQCLASLARLDYPHLDLLVVDNAPPDDAAERAVRASFPQIRYVREDRPGLDWARNRAIAEARGDILAYTDDDCVVDPGWVAALVTGFADPGVMGMTGLVVPEELETEAQVLFERYGGFGRGFHRRWFRLDSDTSAPSPTDLGTGACGTGANMAFRRAVFVAVGPFDPALDVGTVTNGGGDLEMFFRVVMEGFTLLYEPAAIVRHRHRRGYDQLRTQLANNGVGFYAYLARTVEAYPAARKPGVRLAWWWLWAWTGRRLGAGLTRPGAFPVDLTFAELRGSVVGLGRYRRARRIAARIAHATGSDLPPLRPGGAPAVRPDRGGRMAVRSVDIAAPLRPLDGVEDAASVRVLVTRGEEPVGTVDIAHGYGPVGVSRIADAMAAQLGLHLIEPRGESREVTWARLTTALISRFGANGGSVEPFRLPTDVPVSVVVATHDRPDDLRRCLRSLVDQRTPRVVELVVVDNHPGSGLTPPVVAEFPGVRLVSEPRQGLSYARNRGIVASSGDVVVATDDDVVAPPGWLERLVAPFAQDNVAVVTGNVLPERLDTPAERLFEQYGGLGRGFTPIQADTAWFSTFRRRAVPTWQLGATANAAFRTNIFADPQIGLLDEALGAGTPTGCSEDTDLFYRVLRAGYVVAYEPTAYVWHRHRQDMAALQRQVYAYSKGHVAYHLTTLLRDRDARALSDLMVRLPAWDARKLLGRTKRSLIGGTGQDPDLARAEVLGHLAGPWSLWRSRRRARRLGRSDPYVPLDRRPASDRWADREPGPPAPVGTTPGTKLIDDATT